MGYVEEDETRIVGIMPAENMEALPVGRVPDGCIQDEGHGTAANQTTKIYTVPANYVFFLTYAQMSAENAGSASSMPQMKVLDATDTEYLRIFTMRLRATTARDICVAFTTPFVLPAGYSIALYSASADVNVYGTVHGYRQLASKQKQHISWE